MPFLILPHMYECTVYGSFHEQYYVMIDLHSSYNGHPINKESRALPSVLSFIQIILREHLLEQEIVQGSTMKD